MRGPEAPKDPVKKRPCLYVILDKMISGRKEADGICREHIFLEGRLKGQVKFTSGEVPDEILSLLETVSGFRKLVHSVGITIKSEDASNPEDMAGFCLQCYGRTSKYSSGTCMEVQVPCSGAESILQVSDYPENDEDTVIGSFNLTLPKENQNMILTVKFYLNDGYEVPEIEVDPPVQFGTDRYQKMIANSLVSAGNQERIRRVITRTKRGEDVTVAFIGGSITQGAGAKPINIKCYSYLAYQQFCQRFSPCEGKNVHYCKAGVGGTSSELGLLRYDRDVCQEGSVLPDLVFVEFAVNDEGDETNGVCFESLINKILNAQNHPAVALVFAVFMDDWNLQERLIPIGERYELPMVSIKNAVSPQFSKDSVITKRQYFYDIYHPTNLGHQIMADCIGYLFDQWSAAETYESNFNDRQEKTKEKKGAAASGLLTKPPVYGTQFSNVCLFDRSNVSLFARIQTNNFDQTDIDLQYVERNMDLIPSAQFPDNWCSNGAPDSELRLRITCRNLFVIMKDSGAPDFGKAEVYVDGTYVKTLDPRIIGWNHCHAVLLIDETSLREHEVRFVIPSSEKGKKFTILGFGVSR